MFPWVRDRLIADRAYLFKILTEVTIDTGNFTDQDKLAAVIDVQDVQRWQKCVNVEQTSSMSLNFTCLI